MADTNILTASLEDYLESIFHIIEEKQVARPKDIAEQIKVSNASVTGALRVLAEKQLINYTPYNYITLTQAGRVAASDIIRRHEVLRDFFINVLAVEEKEADEAACQMEHTITRPLLERFIQFAEFVKTCPRGGEKWIAGFAYRCAHGELLENCEDCVSTCLEQARQQNKDRFMSGAVSEKTN
jgi:DtxR family transcriptional regulator, Mn-dependent transcriptional regulator